VTAYGRQAMWARRTAPARRRQCDVARGAHFGVPAYKRFAVSDFDRFKLTNFELKIKFAQYKSEGPIRRTREGGSEWEPIKILLEGDGNSYKMNTTSNTRLRLTTQVGQGHVATGVPLDLGTNTHTLSTREHSGTPNLESTDQHRSDR
jgi:hypothetical protein